MSAVEQAAHNPSIHEDVYLFDPPDKVVHVACRVLFLPTAGTVHISAMDQFFFLTPMSSFHSLSQLKTHGCCEFEFGLPSVWWCLGLLHTGLKIHCKFCKDIEILEFISLSFHMSATFCLPVHHKQDNLLSLFLKEPALLGIWHFCDSALMKSEKVIWI